MTLGFSPNLGIRFEPVLAGLFLLKAMPLYSSMPSMSKDMSNNSTNQREAQNCSIVGSNKKIIHSNIMRTNRNELIRRLLSGITNEEIQLKFGSSTGRSKTPYSRTEKNDFYPCPKKNGSQGTKSDILRITPTHHIDRFQPPEKRNSSQCQRHGQELVKNGGL